MFHQSLQEILHPVACAADRRVRLAGHRFVYYTTAEVAVQVIQNRRMWMRNTTTMNDYMEIQYGQNLVSVAMHGDAGAEFKSALELSHAGLFDEIANLVQSWYPEFASDTFITCFSEHDESEDEVGRLSMWRAYGGKTGVALVINGAAFDVECPDLQIIASPVAYMNQAQLIHATIDVAANVRDSASYLLGQPRDDVRSALFSMFRFAVLCTKHPAFAEEKEWRLMSSPKLGQSPLLERRIVTVRGVPQPVLKIPLEDIPGKNTGSLALPNLIDQIIIGPCEFPLVTLFALRESMLNQGLSIPRIVVSNIPLRHT